jgi:hypothetical protein
VLIDVATDYRLECSEPIEDLDLPTDYPPPGDDVVVVVFIGDREPPVPLDECSNVRAFAPATDGLLDYLGYDVEALKAGAP